MDSVKTLVKEGLGNKLVFGSHAPVFMPAAAMARVLNDLSDEVAVATMKENAARLLT
jgi:predicted TIM-barrel fold metal-dependent hydrolase